MTEIEQMYKGYEERVGHLRSLLGIPKFSPSEDHNLRAEQAEAEVERLRLIAQAARDVIQVAADDRRMSEFSALMAISALMNAALASKDSA